VRPRYGFLLLALLGAEVVTPRLCCAQGTPGAILKDSSRGYRAEFSTSGNLLRLVVSDREVIRGGGYSVSTGTTTQSAWQETMVGLAPSGLGGPLRLGTPYYAKPPITYLTQTGSESGVACFDVAAQVPSIPDGREIALAFTCAPTGANALEVVSIWTYLKGTNRLTICRRLTNPSLRQLLLLSEKDFLAPLGARATFTVADGVAQASFRGGDFLAHLFLRRLPAIDKSGGSTLLGSVAEEDLGSELISPVKDPHFDADQAQGKRWLEGIVSWSPGGLFLGACGCAKTVCFQIDVQVEAFPSPPVDPGHTECPQYPCPEYFNYWVSCTEKWPLDRLPLGKESYEKAALLALLTNYATTDASAMLARQLAMAKLNLAAGTDPEPVQKIVGQADALLSEYPGKAPFNVSTTSVKGQQMWQLSVILDFYNRRQLTPNCGGER
jgi:hypothetical protein